MLSLISKMYISKVKKSSVKSFFNQGSWSWEHNMTSILFQKENGNLIQVFGAKGEYKNLEKEAIGISDNSGRILGLFNFVAYSNKIENVSGYYVFK